MQAVEDLIVIFGYMMAFIALYYAICLLQIKVSLHQKKTKNRLLKREVLKISTITIIFSISFLARVIYTVTMATLLRHGVSLVSNEIQLLEQALPLVFDIVPISVVLCFHYQN